MKKKNKYFILSAASFLSFVIWTVLLLFVDRAPIGPDNSVVGFSALNGHFSHFVGNNMLLYQITDWLGLVPICIALFFFVLGAVQLIKRKSIFKVDRSILLLGGIYLSVIIVFLFFEVNIINYRPILIVGRLEASYPSSTTMLSLSVLITAAKELDKRINNRVFRRISVSFLILFAVFMTVARVLSGVHWITDIIGGVLISTALSAWFIALSDK